MRVTTHRHLLRETIREMLQESGASLGFALFKGTETGQNAIDYAGKLKYFSLATIPSGLGPDGFVGKSVYLQTKEGYDREVFVAARNAANDADATEYIVYLDWDPGPFSIDDSILDPPSVLPIGDRTLKNRMNSSDWTWARRADEVINFNDISPDSTTMRRFRIIKGAPGTKVWRVFTAPAKHTVGDKVLSASTLALDTLGGIAEFAETMISSPHPTLKTIGVALKAGNTWLTAGAIAGSLASIADSWADYSHISDLKTMEPEAKKKQIDIKLGRLGLDFFGLLLSGIALFCDQVIGGSLGTAGELFAIATKASAYLVSFSGTVGNPVPFIRDLIDKYKEVYRAVLNEIERVAISPQVRAALAFCKRMLF